MFSIDEIAWLSGNHVEQMRRDARSGILEPQSPGERGRGHKMGFDERGVMAAVLARRFRLDNAPPELAKKICLFLCRVPLAELQEAAEQGKLLVASSAKEPTFVSGETNAIRNTTGSAQLLFVLRVREAWDKVKDARKLLEKRAALVPALGND
jgi:hypothetical protein